MQDIINSYYYAISPYFTFILDIFVVYFVSELDWGGTAMVFIFKPNRIMTSTQRRPKWKAEWKPGPTLCACCRARLSLPIEGLRLDRTPEAKKL